MIVSAHPGRRSRILLLSGLLLAAAATLAGCAGTASTRSAESAGSAGPAGGAAGTPSGPTPPAAGRGGYYLDDGPGLRTPQEVAALAALPDPVPVEEPLHPRANRPYRVLGNDYQPMTQRVPFVQQGIASWYGRKFHGQSTSIGDRYDMYGMTAAHPTLPLPSYARVTNLENGRSVVVRINDRGPFLHGRVIDLSYLAAHKLGYVDNGSARVQVELLDASTTTLAAKGRSPVAAQVVSTSHAVPARTAVPASPTDAPPVIAAAPAAMAPPAAAAAPPAEAHFLQLGAFGSAANAEAAAATLRRQLSWLQVPIELQPAGGLYRVQAGPFALREQAAQAGDEVTARTGLRPLLLPR